MSATSYRRALSERARLVRPSRMREYGHVLTSIGNDGQAPLVDLAAGAPALAPAPVLEQLDPGRSLVQPTDAAGSPTLRQAIAANLLSEQELKFDPDREVTVTPGATEALNAALLSLINPGDEVVVLEPYFDTYTSQIAMAGGVPRFVRLEEPDWRLEEDRVLQAFNRRTRAVLLNAPHNPTGRAFTLDEMEMVASMCRRWGAFAIVDETYRSIVYPGHEHVSLASLPDMRARSVTIGGFTKTMNVPGWRLGYVAAPARLTSAIRSLLSITAPRAGHDQQLAAYVGLVAADRFAAWLVGEHAARRAQLAAILTGAGFSFSLPEAASFIFADASHLGLANDRQASQFLARQLRVASLPGSCFYRPRSRTQRLRFCFARRPELLAQAGERLAARLP